MQPASRITRPGPFVIQSPPHSMTARRLSTALFLLCLAAYSAVYLRGVARVPYHPDESSYLYMSDELESLLTRPAALYFNERSADWPRQAQRLLNPPLLHYVVELGRRAAGLDPLPVNWDWSQPWQVNLLAGALPSPELLQAGRMAVAVLFPLSLLLFFFTVRRVSGDVTAWLAVLLLAANALLLLHTRRVMAEGLLIFTLMLFLWTLVHVGQGTAAGKHPWLTAIPAALCICAKLSLAPMALVGLAAVVWPPDTSRGWAARARQAVLFGVLVLVLTLALYPVAWQRPIRTVEEILRIRDDIAAGQMQKYAAQVIHTPAERLSALVRQVYYAAPSFYEDPMYASYTAESEAAYLANPLHTLLRSPVAGSLLLVLSLSGMLLAAWRILHRGPRPLALLLFATLLQAAALLAAVPLEWQRYYLPLLPFVCFWAAYALTQVRLRPAAF